MDWSSDLPVWKQPAFITLLAAILGAIGWIAKMIFSRPKLRGKIVGMHTQGRHGDSGEAILIGQLMIGVKVWNKRKKPTTVQDWQLVVKHKGKRYQGRRIDYHQPSFGKCLDIGTVIHLADDCRSNPLQEGIHKEGVLFFEVSGVCRDLEKDSKLILQAVDATKRVHKIASKRFSAEIEYES